MAENKNISNEDLERIKKLIESVRFGSVNIIIQDGKIVQIDKNEKIRL
ncbi:MAG: YezD family protein [Lachnospiraceae bacterium]|nr:YezD family protein [Lachnospiraceae bacterium]MBP5565143.1 YezD family protein [Lachnospiraceae bacterium]